MCNHTHMTTINCGWCYDQCGPPGSWVASLSFTWVLGTRRARAPARRPQEGVAPHLPQGGPGSPALLPGPF